MSLPLSREVGTVLTKAKELAGGSHRGVSTGHVLLALFEVPNHAAKLLSDRAVEAGNLKSEMEKLDGEQEHLLERVRRRSQRLAAGSRAEAVTSLHLLAALMRENSSQAYAILEGCGIDMGAVRTAVMSYATSSRPVPKRLQIATPGAGGDRRGTRSNHRSEKSNKPTPSTIGFHPSLGVGKKTKKKPDTDAEDAADEGRGQRRRSRRDFSDQRDEKQPPETRGRAGGSSRKTRNTGGQNKTGSGGVKGVIENLRETGGGLALDNHPGINRGGRPRRTQKPGRGSHQETGHGGDEDGSPATADDVQKGRDEKRRSQALDEARKTARDLADRLFADDEVTARSAEAADGSDEDAPVFVDKDLAKQYVLDEEDYPFLTEFGRNLSQEAALGEIDAVIGRGSEIAQLIDILGKRRANNPLLVGEPGVGKTAIAEGLALELAELAQDGKAAGERTIIELEMGRILSGTHLRGAFSERLLGIKDEVACAGGDVIVFLDEIHMWLSAGSGGDGGDAAGELKTALARGKFPCIGATTHDECRKFVESDPAFERRFQRVTVDEPDEETSLRIIEGVRTHYERHHGVVFSPAALAASVMLAVRYIHDRYLPDKAIGVLDLAGSRAARQGMETVDRDAIAHVVADMASIPAERLIGGEGDRFMNMEYLLSRGIVGHDEIVESIAELLRRNYAGFRSQRPIGSLLFLGPTGVGKTEMVKVLADFLFHDRDAIVRVDMSEFMESHSVSRLIGSPPGYVGHDKGGQLTEAVRQRPYQVVLLDEIEKAHTDVLNLLLQLFDEGQLTDGRGRQVDFSNALVVMTSNLGSSAFEEAAELESTPIGFSSRGSQGQSSSHRDEQKLRDEVLGQAQKHFTPELWNRIDERLVFMPLSRDEIAKIAELQLADSQQRLRKESDIVMDYEPGVIDHLIEHGGYDRRLGARPMRQTIQRLVEGEVARAILSGRAAEGERIVVAVVDGEIVVRQ